MSESVFMRIEGEGKDIALFHAVRGLSESKPNPVLHTLRIAGLTRIPLAPFAYWVGEGVRQLFATLPPFEGDGRTVKQGLATADDFRFVRVTWETPLSLASDPARTWFPFAKGGSYSPFYADIFLCVNWCNAGGECKNYIIQRYPYLNGNAGFVAKNTAFYFRPGLTWPLRTTSGLALRAMPTGCVFGHKGPAAFTNSEKTDDLMALLALSASQPFQALVALQLAAAEAAARSYEVGVIQRTVVPSNLDPRLAELALAAWTAKRRPDTANLTSHAFLRPALAESDSSLVEGTNRWSYLLTESAAAIAAARSEIDDVAYRLYGLGDIDRRAIEKTVGSPETGANESTGDSGEDEEVEDSPAAGASGPALVSELLDYVLGAAFGRWDIRYATGEQAARELPDPFAPLPVCPPGQLQSAQGLPALPEDVPAAYPVRIPWDGILVDDPNHPLDLERRVREVIEFIWSGKEGGPTAEAIEHEACEILGVKSLRDYFRKPTGSFADHLKRYSKSRRQAPIYWPLSTASGSYTLWIYYHRLTPDTLYKCVQQFINPMLADMEKELNHLRTILAANEGGVKERKRLEELEDLRREVIELRAELELWAPKWKPNLNDGVLITAAPLWKLFRLPKWQKDLKACWQKLEKGDYDWSHLAHTLWPARVREKCKSDRSLAIAHGLEELCAVQAQVKRAEKAKKQLETELEMEP